MATYVELETIIRDPGLQQRVMWACRVAAEAIIGNAGATAVQLKWADKVRRQGERAVNLTAICAQLFKDAAAQGTVSTVASVVQTSATDSQIQGRVNSIIASGVDLGAL